jgi:penicillin-binding protein 1A
MADIQGMFKWFKRLLWLLLLVLSVGIAAVAAFYFHLEKDLPDVSTLRDTTWETPLRVYSSDGVLMSEFGDVKRIPLRIEQIPVQKTGFSGNRRLSFLRTPRDRFNWHS